MIQSYNGIAYTAINKKRKKIHAKEKKRKRYQKHYLKKKRKADTIECMLYVAKCYEV